MRDVFDIWTIIFLALGVFIFLRLRSVLGQRIAGLVRDRYRDDFAWAFAARELAPQPRQ